MFLPHYSPLESRLQLNMRRLDNPTLIHPLATPSLSSSDTLSTLASHYYTYISGNYVLYQGAFMSPVSEDENLNMDPIVWLTLIWSWKTGELLGVSTISYAILHCFSLASSAEFHSG